MIATSNRLSTTSPDTRVSLQTFLASIQGTPDEIWGHLLGRRNASDKKTMADWAKVIGAFKSTPAN